MGHKEVLSLIGGLCLFLFGMNIMGDALERRAGSKLSSLIGKLTSNRFLGFLTGLAVTAIIQSSSATTVMVVGFVNSGLMTLKQSIGVIMGANIGTTVTAWILSLGGIDSSNILVEMFKPTFFTPILAVIGIIFTMFGKSNKKKDNGFILLGFAVLMFGMDAMSAAVSGLRDVPEFQQMFVMFKEPILGVLVGAILTAILQSSSASVGILQALTVTGQVSYGAAFPIIMGQNIGTCVTAILSSFGANRNAKRVALVHLSFNIIGTAILLVALYVVRAVWPLALLDATADHFGIAVSHSIFNVICTAILFPMGGLLEKLACKLVPEAKTQEKKTELDERLLATPTVALESSRKAAVEMAKTSITALQTSLSTLFAYTDADAEKVRELEELSDHYEDIIGSYLVKISSHHMDEKASTDAAKLLHLIGDFERISDHSVNLLESAEEMKNKGIELTENAKGELKVLVDAVVEITDLALTAFVNDDIDAAFSVEPLEEIIDRLKEKLRAMHICRLQQGQCSIEAGFVWSDLLTNLERVSDHCSNIAGCMIEASGLSMHESLHILKSENSDFKKKFAAYSAKYSLPGVE